SAADILPVDVVPTVVAGAKGVWRSNGYIRMLEAVLVPALSGIARYLDFVLDGLGTTDAVRLAALGRTRGLRPRVHVDRVEALEAAFDCRAVSVDGMWGLEEAAESVAESDMVMVSVPAASWLQGRPDPARQMWDAGTVVALGTGCEGGSVPTVPMAMAVAVHHGGLTPEESLWSATRGGALAIEDPERGMVRPGCVAGLALLEAETAAVLVDGPGKDPVVRVIKDGSPLGSQGRSIQSSTMPSLRSPWHRGSVVAHRGSRILWPENTMLAFGSALDAGADHLETDLHATADGHLVCFHDHTVDRTTDGTGPVSRFDLAELRRLDAGYRHRLDGDFPFRGRGIRVPTLGEVLATFPDIGVVV